MQRYPEYLEFRSRSKKGIPEKAKKAEQDQAERTPEEELESAFLAVRAEVISELLEELRNSSWQFFERLVLDLLVGMGYGGDRRDAGRATRVSGDEGVDGLINEDRLGLDVIYLQAKKWEAGRTVQRPEIQKFAGALQGQRARKGVFVTTSSFSQGAREFAKSIEAKIVLIDGHRLAELMYEHDIGVSTTGRYEVKRLDTDYFEGT